MVDKTSIVQSNAFAELNEDLLGLGTTYLSLIVLDENSNAIISQSSDLDWSSEFIENGLYKDCHLLAKASSLMTLHKSGSFTLAWDSVLPVGEKQKSLEDIRKQKNIMHGVGFCNKDTLGNKIFLNIAGKYSDVNFGLNVLRERKEIYKKLHKFLLKAIS